MTTHPNPAGTIPVEPVTTDTLLELVALLGKSVDLQIAGYDRHIKQEAQELRAEIEEFRATLDPTLPGSSETTT